MTRKVVASTYVTLDGYIDEPGQWSFAFWSDEAAQFKARELFASDAMLLGRITYEGFAKAWPAMREEAGVFGEKMNDMPKYVASRTLASAQWTNSRVIQGDVAAEVRRLKQDDGGDLLVAGSGQLIDYLAEHGLVDEYRLMVHPVILGSGSNRLFGGAPRRDLVLDDVLRLPNGVLVNTYHPKGA